MIKYYSVPDTFNLFLALGITNNAYVKAKFAVELMQCKAFIMLKIQILEELVWCSHS